MSALKMADSSPISTGGGSDSALPSRRVRANGKRLTADDRESLVRVALAAVPLMTAYQAASHLMDVSVNYGEPRGVKITRRSAMHLLQQARSRLRAEIGDMEPDFRQHTIWKARELYREVLKSARSNAATAYRYYRVLADLIRVDVSIGGSSPPVESKENETRQIVFRVATIDGACGQSDGK